jgi:hypothetical protein
MKPIRNALTGVGCTVLIALMSSLAAGAAPNPGKNAVSGRVAGEACEGLVYLYPYYPDISGADGNVKLPLFAIPAADDEHWEARCSGGTFAFADIPDGTYLVGKPGPRPTGHARVASVTIEGGQSVQVELKPQSNAQ